MSLLASKLDELLLRLGESEKEEAKEVQGGGGSEGQGDGKSRKEGREMLLKLDKWTSREWCQLVVLSSMLHHGCWDAVRTVMRTEVVAEEVVTPRVERQRRRKEKSSLAPLNNAVVKSAVVMAAKEQYNSARSVFDDCLDTASMMLELVADNNDDDNGNDDGDNNEVDRELDEELKLLQAASIVRDFGCSSILPLELRLTVPKTSLLRKMLKRSQSLQGDQSEQLLTFASLLSISGSKAQRVVYTGEIRKHLEAHETVVALSGCWKLLTQLDSGGGGGRNRQEVYALCVEVVGGVVEARKRRRHPQHKQETALLVKIVARGLVAGPDTTLPAFVVFNQSPWTLLPQKEDDDDEQQQQQQQQHVYDWAQTILNHVATSLLQEAGSNPSSLLWHWHQSTALSRPRASLFR